MRHRNAAMLEEANDYYDDPSMTLVAAQPPPAPEQIVMARTKEAFDVLRRIPSSIGPRSFGSNWPAILREIDSDSLTQIRRMTGAMRALAKNQDAEVPDYMAYAIQYLSDREATTRRKLDAESDAPTKYDVSRMDEALGWPALHLRDYAIGADALNTWAMSQAFGRSLDGILKARAKAARRLADYIAAQLNEKRERRIQKLAFDSSQWAKMKYRLSPRTEEAIARIVANAQIRLERDIAKHSLSKHMIVIDPADVSPDKAISRTSLDRHRYRAAQIIARALEGK